MTISNFTELKTAIQGYLWNRTDVVAQIPDFIRLAEAQMFRRLDCRQMQYLAVVQIRGETAQIPCGFAGVESFRVNSTTPHFPLEYVRPDAMDSSYSAPNSLGEHPRYYTIVGDQFLFAPYPASSEDGHTARLRFRKRPEALGAGNPTNWILDDHPDAYLYGALAQSAPWLHQDERLATWVALFTTAITDINRDDLRQAHGATLQLQPASGVI